MTSCQPCRSTGSSTRSTCVSLLLRHILVRLTRRCCQAQVLDDGRIYGRGTQDMKSVCVQYAEAVRALKSSGFVPERNVHLLYVPDEEIGGPAGMQGFVESDAFREMLGPVAFALDEGLANTGDKFTVFYGERTQWALYVKATGPTGHGSRFIQHTATQKLIDVCNKVSAMLFR